MRSDDADVELGEAGLHGEDGRGALEQHRYPAGAVLRPPGVDDLAALEPQRRRDPADQLLVDRPRAKQRGRREGEAVGVRRTVTRPAAHSWVIVSGAPPPWRSSQAWHVPSVGWPAKGSSATGVKMRTR